MAEQQLFCDPDDRHRAVLLAGCLKDMGQPTRLVDAPEPPAPRALLLWTNRASRSPWLSQLLRDHRDLIVLAIDSAPLPADCTHVLALQTWPARSADRSIGELVSWLKDSSRPAPFARRAPASTEPGGGSALIVLGLLVLIVGAAVLGSRSADTEQGDGQDTVAATELRRPAAGPGTGSTPRTSNPVQRPAGRSGEAPPSTAVGDAASSNPATAPVVSERASGEKVAAATALVGSESASGEIGEAATARVQSDGPSLESRNLVTASRETERVPADFGPSTPRAERVEPEFAAGVRLPAGGSSLDHLCRAQSLAAAQAWYRVLNARQRREAPTLPCVRALLDRPGYEPLREEIQA